MGRDATPHIVVDGVARFRLAPHPKTRPPPFGLAFILMATFVAHMNARPPGQRFSNKPLAFRPAGLALGQKRAVGLRRHRAARGHFPCPFALLAAKAVGADAPFLKVLVIIVSMTSRHSMANSVKSRLPVHRRVNKPPAMRLTHRDRQVVSAIYEYRFLRRDQVQTLFFPSQNTANRRLQHLYQHGFLRRHLPPIQLGEGREQAIYGLDERGADLIAVEYGIDREAVHWRRKDNQARFFFLDHTLRINDFRIAITLAAQKRGHRVSRWLDEREIKALGERVSVPERFRRYLPVTPDAFFEYDFGDRKAGFFLEMDMGTMTNRRFKDKIRAFIIYKTEGHYQAKFGTPSLRVLTVTSSLRRLQNLKRATEQVQGRSLFWFTTFAALTPPEIIKPVWYIAGQPGTAALFENKPDLLN